MITKKLIIFLLCALGVVCGILLYQERAKNAGQCSTRDKVEQPAMLDWTITDTNSEK